MLYTLYGPYKGGGKSRDNIVSSLNELSPSFGCYHLHTSRAPRASSLKIREDHGGHCLGFRAPSCQNDKLQGPPC